MVVDLEFQNLSNSPTQRGWDRQFNCEFKANPRRHPETLSLKDTKNKQTTHIFHKDLINLFFSLTFAAITAVKRRKACWHLNMQMSMETLPYPNPTVNKWAHTVSSFAGCFSKAHIQQLSPRVSKSLSSHFRYGILATLYLWKQLTSWELRTVTWAVTFHLSPCSRRALAIQPQPEPGAERAAAVN